MTFRTDQDDDNDAMQPDLEKDRNLGQEMLRKLPIGKSRDESESPSHEPIDLTKETESPRQEQQGENHANDNEHAAHRNTEHSWEREIPALECIYNEKREDAAQAKAYDPHPSCPNPNILPGEQPRYKRQRVEERPNHKEQEELQECQDNEDQERKNADEHQDRIDHESHEESLALWAFSEERETYHELYTSNI